VRADRQPQGQQRAGIGILRPLLQQRAGFGFGGGRPAQLIEYHYQGTARRVLHGRELEQLPIGLRGLDRTPAPVQQLAEIEPELRVGGLDLQALPHQQFAGGGIAGLLADQPEQVQRRGLLRNLLKQRAAGALGFGEPPVLHQIGDCDEPRLGHEAPTQIGRWGRCACSRTCGSAAAQLPQPGIARRARCRAAVATRTPRAASASSRRWRRIIGMNVQAT